MKKTDTSIEDIILSDDRRGIGVLRPRLSEHFCTDAAEYILQHPGTTLITTGFYIPKGGAPETDGPNGALAIGDALRAINQSVVYVTGTPLSLILTDYLNNEYKSVSVIEFPFTEEHEENMRIAEKIIDAHNPALLISVERCSPTASGKHLNMHGNDISDNTPRVEYLFMKNIPSVGVGDGGNEICMGNFADSVKEDEHLPDEPATITCNHPVIASVSNWGAYGIVAALSLATNRNLLPSQKQEIKRLKHLVDAGIVDGTTGRQEYRVDGFTAEENTEVLQKLHTLVKNSLSLT